MLEMFMDSYYGYYMPLNVIIEMLQFEFEDVYEDLFCNNNFCVDDGNQLIITRTTHEHMHLLCRLDMLHMLIGKTKR